MLQENNSPLLPFDMCKEARPLECVLSVSALLRVFSNLVKLSAEGEFLFSVRTLE